MTEELQAAEDAGQRAWIIGHIPLGKQDVFNDQVRFIFGSSALSLILNLAI